MRLVALLAGLAVAALADHSLAWYSPVMDLDCAPRCHSLLFRRHNRRKSRFIFTQR